MISSVAKKRKEPESPHQEEPLPDAHLLRFDDLRLVKAIDEWKKTVRTLRKSRNLAIIVLLEEMLQIKGYWPPEESD